MEAARNLDTSGHTPDVETAHYVETAEHDVEATGHDVEAAGRTPGVGHTYAATRALGRRAAARVVCRKYLWRDYPWRDDVNDFNESSAEHAGVTGPSASRRRTSHKRVARQRRPSSPTEPNSTEPNSISFPLDTYEFRSRILNW